MDTRTAYTPITGSDIDPEPVHAESFLRDELHQQAVKVVIALYVLVHTTQPNLLKNLHLVNTGVLIKINNGEDYGKIITLLQVYYKQYIASTISTEKSREYANLFTRLKHSVRQQNAFSKVDLTQDQSFFYYIDIINHSLSAVFSILEKVFSAEEVTEILLKSPKLGSLEDKKTDNLPTGTVEEEKNLIEHYYEPQISREQEEYDVIGYQEQDRMFNNLDKAIFNLMKLGRAPLVKKLLRHRLLLVTYLLNNNNNVEKIHLVQKLARATGKVMNSFIKNSLDAKTINAAITSYYADCVTSNAALRADSTGNRIIKSIAAIAVGLLFCALVLSVAWLISYYWAGIVLLDISWKIQTGIGVTAICSLALSGFFSFKKLRGTGYLDSKINQSTKTIAEDMRAITKEA